MTTTNTTRMQIRVYDSTDWGCDHTANDADAYEAAVTTCIGAAYPEADLKIMRHNGPTRVMVFDCPLEIERDVAANIERILERVWDRADFWPR